MISQESKSQHSPWICNPRMRIQDILISFIKCLSLGLDSDFVNRFSSDETNSIATSFCLTALQIQWIFMSRCLTLLYPLVYFVNAIAMLQLHLIVRGQFSLISTSDNYEDIIMLLTLRPQGSQGGKM